MKTSFPRPPLSNPVEVPATNTVKARQAVTGGPRVVSGPAITVPYQTGTILSFTLSISGERQREFIRHMNAKVRGSRPASQSTVLSETP